MMIRFCSICWLGVVATITLLLFAGWWGYILLGILAAVVGWYYWSLPQEVSNDYDDWE